MTIFMPFRVLSILVTLLASAQGCEFFYMGDCPVNLGKASSFAVLAKAGISTVPASAVTGNIGVSPISAGALTGFSLIPDLSNSFSTSLQVTGNCYAADYAVPTPSDLTTTIGDMEIAYADAAGRANTKGYELGAGLIGGLTLYPGVYTWSSTLSIQADIYFDGQGNSNAVFILQIAQGVVVAANKRITLMGGAKASNIFWKVSENVVVGAGAHFEGTLLVKTAVSFLTGSSLNGRILCQTAAALQMATVVIPAEENIVTIYENVCSVLQDNSTNCTEPNYAQNCGAIEPLKRKTMKAECGNLCCNSCALKIDTNAFCKQDNATQYCGLYPVWMSQNCASLCCDAMYLPPAQSCAIMAEDLNSFCYTNGAAAFCDGEHAGWMQAECPRLCNC